MKVEGLGTSPLKVKVIHFNLWNGVFFYWRKIFPIHWRWIEKNDQPTSIEHALWKSQQKVLGVGQLIFMSFFLAALKQIKIAFVPKVCSVDFIKNSNEVRKVSFVVWLRSSQRLFTKLGRLDAPGSHHRIESIIFLITL